MANINSKTDKYTNFNSHLIITKQIFFLTNY